MPLDNRLLILYLPWRCCAGPYWVPEGVYVRMYETSGMYSSLPRVVDKLARVQMM